MLAFCRTRPAPLGSEPPLPVITRLALTHPLLARVVELRAFGGLCDAEIARELNIPEPVAHRLWFTSRAMMRDMLDN